MATWKLKALHHGSFEGIPIILAEYEGGAMAGFAWSGKGWLGGFTDEAMSAGMLTPEQFKDAYPDAPEFTPPASIETESST